MSASTKLSTSAKALCHMAANPNSAFTSTEIACVIGVNASKLRRLLSMLVKNDIIQSEQGVQGGFKLKKAASEIDLQEVYCAIEDRKAFHLDVRPQNGDSQSDSAKLNHYFLDLFADIQVDIETKMKHISIKTIIEQSKL